jgi:hypothetical protein
MDIFRVPGVLRAYEDQGGGLSVMRARSIGGTLLERYILKELKASLLGRWLHSCGEINEY